MLVLFPIGFWLSAFLCDLIYWQTTQPAFATAAMWLVGAGLIGAALAAVAGLIDFTGDRAIRALPDAWQHMIGNVFAVLLALGSFALRLTQGAEAAVLPWGLALSTAVALVLVFTGWKGGELVFRHGVGVEPAQRPMMRSRAEREQDRDRPVLH
jgi:uncharacterized membrane protein